MARRNAISASVNGWTPLDDRLVAVAVESVGQQDHPFDLDVDALAVERRLAQILDEVGGLPVVTAIQGVNAIAGEISVSFMLTRVLAPRETAWMGAWTRNRPGRPEGGRWTTHGFSSWRTTPTSTRWWCERLGRDGYACVSAYSGSEARLALEQATVAGSPYALVVTDLMLPGLSGDRLVAGLRESGSGVPVVVISARGAVDDRIGLLRPGCRRLSGQTLRPG